MGSELRWVSRAKEDDPGGNPGTLYCAASLPCMHEEKQTNMQVG